MDWLQPFSGGTACEDTSFVYSWSIHKLNLRTWIPLFWPLGSQGSNNIPAKNSKSCSFLTLLNHRNMILDSSENSWMVMSTTPQIFLDGNDILLGRKFYYLEKLNSKIGRKTYYVPWKTEFKKWKEILLLPKIVFWQIFWMKGVQFSFCFSQ